MDEKIKTELEEMFGIDIDNSVYEKSEQSKAVLDVFGIDLEQQILDNYLKRQLRINEKAPALTQKKKKKKKLTSTQLYFALKNKRRRD